MNKKMLLRLICALLTVLTMVSVVPALTISAATSTEDDGLPKNDDGSYDYTRFVYEDEKARLDAMTKYFENDEYALYADDILGVVAYHKKSTGEVLFTNPWDMGSVETSTYAPTRAELLSQIILTYTGNNGKTLNSYTDAVMKGQVTAKAIKNGVRIEYAIGERSARILVPQQIERIALEDKILIPMSESIPGGAASRDFIKFYNYFNDMFYTEAKGSKKESIAMQYPITQKKNIDIYVCDVNASTKELRWMESLILAYCPAYSFEEMDNDYDYVDYVEKATSPAVFKMALQYTIDDGGMVVSMSGNGLRYDENVYRITDFQLLPYMGASNRNHEGYTFIPDGSGALYELDTVIGNASRVYGDDYALFSNLHTYHNETVRMPVFGQVEEIPKLISPAEYDTDGTLIRPAIYSDEEKTSRGFFAIIEEGESLAYITPNHVAYTEYVSVIPSFVIRQQDTSMSDWSVYAASRYVDDYKIRYILLSDDERAKEANLSSYYECSWMGMACAYRDYLEKNNEHFDRLTDEEVGTSIPLYIETFGCMDTIKKVLSMPVTVSVALTSFEDIMDMYEYLAGEGVSNVNFKMTGYANGGLYSEVPYKLKWEGAVGGSSGFKDIIEDAQEKGYGLYPDFNFVYTSGFDAGNHVNMKKNAARTIDNRYTTKRVYSATYQTLISYYQLVLSPTTFSKFYEKLEKKYSRYDYAGISLGAFGNALNSDYDEEKTALREEAKAYTIQALDYFKNKNYDIMVDGGNAYTWNTAAHILNVSLDSSRYTAEYSAVPFMGVVLHGYREFAGSPFNMEGNLSYAMLKAMENGASAYFVLSYANTELLKEDELLSQNYSVRYDIWQKRLVEIYHELNAVLFDVQTKLIVDHEILDASRVPDDDELLKDILDAAEAAKKEIEDKIEQDRLDNLNALRDADKQLGGAQLLMTTYASQINELLATMKKNLGSVVNATLIKSWYRPTVDAPATVEQIAALRSAFNSQVVNSFAVAEIQLKEATELLETSKESYDMLKNSDDVVDQVKTEARAELVLVVNAYLSALNAYYGNEITFAAGAVDAYVDGTDASVDALAINGTENDMTVSGADLEAFVFGTEAMPAYAEIGIEGMYDAFCRALEADGYYDPANSAGSAIDVEALYLAKQPVEDTPNTNAPVAPSKKEEVKEDVKYAVDNNVVAVTYGDNATTLYKTLLLNFNDYTIQTVFNGTVYTIEAYGYVVIKY